MKTITKIIYDLKVKVKQKKCRSKTYLIFVLKKD